MSWTGLRWTSCCRRNRHRRSRTRTTKYSKSDLTRGSTSRIIPRLTAVDPLNALLASVSRRCPAAAFPVQFVPVTSESLPYVDGRFDYGVSTWTLCTIPDALRALQEVGRVLKPGGSFLFLEHGRSDDRKIAAWQDRLNPIQNVIGCGCNLNRKIDQLIVQAGLTIIRIDRFIMESIPRLGGAMYRGAATRQN